MPDLLEHLRSGEPARIAAAAQECASRGVAAAARYLLDVLSTTRDVSARNAAALALSDLGVAEAFGPMVVLLTSDDVRGTRGTLLYALGAYDCSSILPLLVTLVIEGNFEESRQAFSLISGIDTDLEDDIWQGCHEQLRSGILMATAERRPLLEELLHCFE